jgi:hypothetical protein
VIRAALTLARKGLHVFPCRPRDKRPATANGLKNATTDLDLIRRWWREDPHYNVAISTGARSGIVVIDIDGLDAEGELRKLEAEHHELPATVEAITARGRHIYFKWPAIPVRNSAGKIAPGIDVRGEGGYVLSPPSVHPCGRRYCWSVDSAGVFAAAPNWLLDKIAARGNSNGPTPPREWRALVATGVGEGVRDNTITRLAGYLLRHRIDPVVSLTLLQSWNSTHCAPPLPAADVERIVGSICDRELRRRGDG